MIKGTAEEVRAEVWGRTEIRQRPPKKRLEWGRHTGRKRGGQMAEVSQGG